MHTLLSLVFALAGSAGAADEPAPGFRLHTAVSTNRATVRSVVVPGPATVFAQAVRVRYGSERWSGELQQNFVQASVPSIDWSQASFGRTVAGARLHFAKARNHAFLLEGDVGVADAQAWGSHAVETLPGFSARLGWEGTWTFGSHTLIARVTGGLGELRGFTDLFPLTSDAGVAWVFPVAADVGLSGVVELETQLVDAIPGGARLLGRWQPASGDWLIDVGGQSATDYVGGSSAAILMQVGRALGAGGR